MTLFVDRRKSFTDVIRAILISLPPFFLPFLSSLNLLLFLYQSIVSLDLFDDARRYSTFRCADTTILHASERNPTWGSLITFFTSSSSSTSSFISHPLSRLHLGSLCLPLLALVSLVLALFCVWKYRKQINLPLVPSDSQFLHYQPTFEYHNKFLRPLSTSLAPSSDPQLLLKPESTLLALCAFLLPCLFFFIYFT